MSRDPRVAPRIQYNFLDDPSDVERLMEVARLTSMVARTEPFASMIDSEITPPLPTDDSRLREHIMASVSTYAHPTSTVPMGRNDDPTAVVDVWGAVRGISGLHVVDASIFPDVPSVPTNVTTVMVAERIAARLGQTSPSVETRQLAGVRHDY
jgi:choline dehydrogenase